MSLRRRSPMNCQEVLHMGADRGQLSIKRPAGGSERSFMVEHDEGRHRLKCYYGSNTRAKRLLLRLAQEATKKRH